MTFKLTQSQTGDGEMFFTPQIWGMIYWETKTANLEMHLSCNLNENFIVFVFSTEDVKRPQP